MNENLINNIYEACKNARASNKDDTIRFILLSVPQGPYGLKYVPTKFEIISKDEENDG